MTLEPTYSVVSNPFPGGNSGLNVLFTGSSQTRPGHRSGPKVVDYYLIHYVESGHGVFVIEGEEYQLSAGDSFVIFPGALVSYTADEELPWRYRWIAFKGAAAQELVTEAGITPEQPIVHIGAGRRELGKAGEESVQQVLGNDRRREVVQESIVEAEGREAAVLHYFEQVRGAFSSVSRSAGMRADGCVRLMLAEYTDAVSERDEVLLPAGAAADAIGDRLVRQAVHYLSAQYAEPITIELMAESLGYNRAYLSRLFKSRTGVSPIEFLSRLRLDRARRLLRERGDLTVEQVASSVGFRDALYFSKQFRRAYGQSPTEYRTSVSSSHT